MSPLTAFSQIAQRPRRDSNQSQQSGPEPEWLDELESPDGPFTAAEARAPSQVGSPGHMQELPHITNLDHGEGLAGYVGKLSEASWMQRCREHLLGNAPLLQPDVNANWFDSHVLQTMDLKYFMDDQELLSTGEETILPYQLPPLKLGLLLTEAYFHCLQGAFRFVEREEFVADFISESMRTTEWPNRHFLALANIVWAVGAKWLELTQLDRHDVLEGHSVYYARARALGLDHRIHLDHPNLQLVQGTGLLGFYLMVNGSMQR